MSDNDHDVPADERELCWWVWVRTAGWCGARRLPAAGPPSGACGAADACTARGSVEQGRQLEGEDLGVARVGLLPLLTIPACQTTP